MNPNSTIRPWLLACGLQFGIRHAYDYRWADADTRQWEAYFTYRLAATQPDQTSFLQDNTDDGYDYTRKGIKQHRTIAEINLHNAQDGLYILGACGIGAEMSEPLREIFKSKQCAFHEILSITDQSFVDNEEIIYRHVMEVSFYERVELALTETNEVVETIKSTIESGDYEWTIDADGYE